MPVIMIVLMFLVLLPIGLGLAWLHGRYFGRFWQLALDDKELTFRHPGGYKNRFPRDEITDVEIVSFWDVLSDEAFRWRSKYHWQNRFTLGRGLVLITRSNGLEYVVTPDDPDAFVRAVRGGMPWPPEHVLPGPSTAGPS